MGVTKRRTIWMPDDEWAALVDFAKRNGRTVSTVIRDSWGPPDGYPSADEEDEAKRQAKNEREAFVKRIGQIADEVAASIPVPEGMVASFNTRPFTPVPKTRK